MCAREAAAPLRDQAQVKKRDGEQREQRNLRIHKKFAGPDIQAVDGSKPALEPCAGGL